MTTATQPANPELSLEATLREELARGDAVANTISPILRHLLSNDSNSVFADDVIASTRGMANDVSRQLLAAQAKAGGADEDYRADGSQVYQVTATLIENRAFLTHLHALALEWQLTQRLQARLSLDPVLPPLLHNLMASTEPAIASLSMHVLAAQVRFCQAQRRMALPLTELPGDLLHGVLLVMRSNSDAADDHVAEAETQIRQNYDEGKSRSGLICRLIVSLGNAAAPTLAISNSGVAVFINALSMSSGQSRDVIALATNDTQLARLALALRATGLKHPEVEAQFFTIHPEIALPPGFDELSPDHAAAILAMTAQSGGN